MSTPINTSSAAPPPSSNHQEWTSEAAAEYARHAAAFTQSFITKAIDQAVAALPLSTTKQQQRQRCIHVLDIAAGTGAATFYLLEALAKAGIHQVHLTATDLNSAMLQQLEAAAPAILDKYPNAKLNVQTMDMQDLTGIATASQDLVTCTFGIMFASDPVQALREIQRVLKPCQGIAVLVTWSWNSHVTDLLEAVAAQGKIASPASVSLPVYNFGSALRLQTWARQAGITAKVSFRYHQNDQGFPLAVDFLSRTINSNPGFAGLFPLVDEPQAAAFLADFADGHDEQGRPYRLCFSTALYTRIGF